MSDPKPGYPYVRVMAAIAVAVAVIAGLIFTLRGGGDQGSSGPGAESATQVALEVSPDPPESSEPGDEPTPEGLEPEPEPEVQPYATGLSGPVHKPGAGPTIATSVKPGYDGCDHAYGAVGTCVPYDFPANVKGAEAMCAWLKKNGFDGPIPVRGADRHKLDPDRNGTACEL